MRKQVIAVLAVAVLGLAAYHVISYDSNTGGSNRDDSPKRGPFDLADPPELEPDDGLLQKIRERSSHEIGYIANDRSKAIYVVDLTDEQYLGRIVFRAEEPRGGPLFIAVTPNAEYFIVTRGKYSNDILIIDSNSLELVKQVPGGKYNDYIVFNPVRNEAYVLSGNYQDTNIYVLDLAALEIVKTIDIGCEINTADISPDSDTLYVATSQGVSFVDVTSGEVFREIPVNTTYWKRVLAHPANGCIYVVNNPDVEERWPMIHVFNASNGENTHNIKHLTIDKTWDGAITGLAMTPNGDRLFSVSQLNELTVIDTATCQVIKTISVKQPGYYGKPDWIYFNAQETKAYFIYYGAIPIDSPGPDTPSKIGVMDLGSYQFTHVIELDEYAGAGVMAIVR
jgi:YVTN family beta-propeller protein